MAEMVNKEGTVLPREIIVWLQSLHLSQQIKHPKRDLSNGFRIAEICHIYWGSNAIELHSFTNSCGVQSKESNWSVLRKAFAKQHIPLSEEMINGMIHCKDKYAECFLYQLYTILTGKELRQHSHEQQNEELLLSSSSEQQYEKKKQQHAVREWNVEKNKSSTRITNEVHMVQTDLIDNTKNLHTVAQVGESNQNKMANQVDANREMLQEYEKLVLAALEQTHITAIDYICHLIYTTLQTYLHLDEMVKDDNKDSYEYTNYIINNNNVYAELLNSTTNNDKNSKQLEYISRFVLLTYVQETQHNLKNMEISNNLNSNNNSPLHYAINVVWNVLHFSLPYIVKNHIEHNEEEIIDIAYAFLFNVGKEKQLAINKLHERKTSSLNSVPQLALCDRAEMFICNLLSLWSDTNPHECFRVCLQHLLTLPPFLYVLKTNYKFTVAQRLGRILYATLSSRSLSLAIKQMQQLNNMLKHYIYNVQKFYHTYHNSNEKILTHREGEEDVNNVEKCCINVTIYDIEHLYGVTNKFTYEEKTRAYLLMMHTLFLEVVNCYKEQTMKNNVSKDSNKYNSKINNNENNNKNDNNGNGSDVSCVYMEKGNITAKHNEDDVQKVLHLFVEILLNCIQSCMHSECKELELLAASVSVSIVKHAASVLSLNVINTIILPLFLTLSCNKKCSATTLHNKECNDKEASTNYELEEWEEQELLTQSDKNELSWMDVMKMTLTRQLLEHFAPFGIQVNKERHHATIHKTSYTNTEIEELKRVTLSILQYYSVCLIKASTNDSSQYQYHDINNNHSVNNSFDKSSNLTLYNLYNHITYELAVCLNYLPQNAVHDNNNINCNTNIRDNSSSSSSSSEKMTAYHVALLVAQSLIHYYNANNLLNSVIDNLESGDQSYSSGEAQKIAPETNKVKFTNATININDNDTDCDNYEKEKVETSMLPKIEEHINIFKETSSLLLTKALFGLYPSYYSIIPESLQVENMIAYMSTPPHIKIANTYANKKVIGTTTTPTSTSAKANRDVHNVGNKIKQKLSNRVSALSRQKNVPGDVAIRIRWLYIIHNDKTNCNDGQYNTTNINNINNTNNESYYWSNCNNVSNNDNKDKTVPCEFFYVALPTLRERKAKRSIWNEWLAWAYDDVALVTMAAELAARQLHNRGNVKNEESLNTLLELAAQAQQVVCHWYTTLSLPDEQQKLNLSSSDTNDDCKEDDNNNSNTNKGSQEVIESAVVRAMRWYHAVFGANVN